MLNGMKLARYQLTLRTTAPMALPPYKGSAFRGGFGYALRRVACPFGTRCARACIMPAKCVYSYLFETPPPQDSAILRKYPAAPHPFVIEPPLDSRRRYEPGEELMIGLVLIGRAIEYLPYFVFTFERLGQMGIGQGRGTYTLERVETLSGRAGGAAVIYDGASQRLRSDGCVVLGEELVRADSHCRAVELEFLTPTRLRFQGRVAGQPEFHVLVRNLLRRASALAYFHCDSKLEADFAGLVKRAIGVHTAVRQLRWVEWERFSGRQEQVIPMGGFVGKTRYEGQLEEFLAFLDLGEIAHVGKGTVFGLGKYRMAGTEAGT